MQTKFNIGDKVFYTLFGEIKKGEVSSISINKDIIWGGIKTEYEIDHSAYCFSEDRLFTSKRELKDYLDKNEKQILEQQLELIESQISSSKKSVEAYNSRLEKELEKKEEIKKRLAEIG